MVSTPRRCSAISTSLPSSPEPSSMTLVALGDKGVPNEFMRYAGSERVNGQGAGATTSTLLHPAQHRSSGHVRRLALLNTGVRLMDDNHSHLRRPSSESSLWPPYPPPIFPMPLVAPARRCAAPR